MAREDHEVSDQSRLGGAQSSDAQIRHLRDAATDERSEGDRTQSGQTRYLAAAATQTVPRVAALA